MDDEELTLKMKKDERDNQKHAMDMMKTSQDIVQNYLVSSDIKKANEMVPTMMIINFIVEDEKSGYINRQMVIGVKAKLYEVEPVDVIHKIITKNVDNNIMLKLVKVSTREISFVKDFLLAIDDAKLDALSHFCPTNIVFKVTSSLIVEEALPVIQNASSAIASVSSVGAFVNIVIDKKALSLNILKQAVNEDSNYGNSTIGNGKNITLDYSAPNIAKSFSVGHLRSTMIGNSINLIMQKCGYSTYSINYLGDWGTQFGKMIVAYQKWGNKEEIEKDPINSLTALITSAASLVPPPIPVPLTIPETKPIKIANKIIIVNGELDFFCFDFLVVKSVNPFLNNIFVKYNAVFII